MKKIMFSDKYGLTDAVLSGCKTMTRRVIKGDYVKIVHLEYEGSFIGKTASGDSVILPQPAYNVGEEVAIAQCYDKVYRETDFELTANGRDFIHDELDKMMSMDKPQAGWTNKLFVRAELMPHHIEITGIRIERLQDISEDDCLKEGIVKTDCVAPYGFPVGNGKRKNYRTPQDAFACLIDKVSGTGTWNSNPWVFAYTFKLVH